MCPLVPGFMNITRCCKNVVMKEAFSNIVTLEHAGVCWNSVRRDFSEVSTHSKRGISLVSIRTLYRDRNNNNTISDLLQLRRIPE